MTASPFPLCFNNNTSANVQEQNSFPLHLTKASQELERDFAVCNTSKKWGPVRLPRGSISSWAEMGTRNEQEGSMDGAGGAVRLREDGRTDRERLAEQLWSSAASVERSGDDLTRAEPAQISPKTPGVMYQTRGAAASLLIPLRHRGGAPTDTRDAEITAGSPTLPSVRGGWDGELCAAPSAPGSAGQRHRQPSPGARGLGHSTPPHPALAPDTLKVLCWEARAAPMALLEIVLYQLMSHSHHCTPYRLIFHSLCHQLPASQASPLRNPE